jgi:hypothetical protein
MSVIVTANYRGETFEVEIFRDGDIEFPGRDFQYEQAVAEFSPPGPATVQLYELWKIATLETVDVVCKNLELPENSQALLVADWAEHVLHVHEDEYQNDRRLRAAIEATRNFLAGKIDRASLEKARVATGEASGRSDDGTAWAAWAVETATLAGAGAADWAYAATAERAARAAACNVSFDSNSQEWRQAHDAEFAWQIRRFVACMEAVGLGKDWPDLGATK